ncbi:MAG: hypothetical protein NTX50_06405 [Candidatus Sumerlaeota bacterium]|nr:hypothetical protein [Candidatus Sumerlaeota bacterium]
MIFAKIKKTIQWLAPDWQDLRQGKWEYAATALSALLLRLAFPKPNL